MTIVRVQGNARGTSITSTLTGSLISTPTVGNLLIAGIGLSDTITLRTISSVSQVGVTWKCISANSRGTVAHGEIWAGEIGAGAAKTMYITSSAAPNGGGIVDICEYSGLLTSNYVDKSGSASGSGTTAVTGTTATTTQANELWIGLCHNNGWTLAAMSTPTNGFILLDGVSFIASSALGYLEAITGSVGAASSGVTTANSTSWCGCIATFFAEATVGAVPVKRRLLMGVGL